MVAGLDRVVAGESARHRLARIGQRLLQANPFKPPHGPSTSAGLVPSGPNAAGRTRDGDGQKPASRPMQTAESRRGPPSASACCDREGAAVDVALGRTRRRISHQRRRRPGTAAARPEALRSRSNARCTAEDSEPERGHGAGGRHRPSVRRSPWNTMGRGHHGSVGGHGSGAGPVGEGWGHGSALTRIRRWTPPTHTAAGWRGDRAA